MGEEQQAKYDTLVDDAEAREHKATRLYYDGHPIEAERMQQSADICFRMASELAFAQ